MAFAVLDCGHRAAAKGAEGITAIENVEILWAEAYERWVWVLDEADGTRGMPAAMLPSPPLPFLRCAIRGRCTVHRAVQNWRAAAWNADTDARYIA